MPTPSEPGARASGGGIALCVPEIGGDVADALCAVGLSLPSSAGLSAAGQDRVTATIQALAGATAS